MGKSFENSKCLFFVDKFLFGKIKKEPNFYPAIDDKEQPFESLFRTPTPTEFANNKTFSLQRKSLFVVNVSFVIVIG
jgi:hypothetical protein